MAFKFLDTHDVVEALQQQEDTSRQRFQHLCDQFHEVLRRLPEPPPDPDAAADSSLSASANDIQAEVAQPLAPPVEETPPEKPLVYASHFDSSQLGPVVLGPRLAGDPALSTSCGALVAGLVAGDARAMRLAGQLLLFRSAPSERYPQLLKDLGEAYYGWRKASADDGRFEAALVAWLGETCAAGGVANSIERVQPGDRFDPVRHQAPQTGVEVAEVQGWVVLRDNGKVYTRAAVTAR